MRRYTEYFGARTTPTNDYIPGTYQSHQGWNIARWALDGRQANLRAVKRWWQPLAKAGSVPSDVRTAALNQAAYLASGSSLWALGLVSTDATPTMGQRLGTAVPDTHVFALITGQDGGDDSFGANPSDVGNEIYDRLFPSLERDALRARTQQIDIAGTPGAFGSYNNSPFIQWGFGGGIGENYEFAQRVWRYYHQTHDADLLRYAYPAMLKLYEADLNTFQVAGDEGALPIGGGRRSSAGHRIHRVSVRRPMTFCRCRGRASRQPGCG